MLRDVSVCEELEDPAWQWQRLHLVGGDGVTQDGAAQVGQTGDGPGGPPESDVSVPGPGGGTGGPGESLHQ